MCFRLSPEVRTLVIERLKSNGVYRTFVPKVREGRRPGFRKRRRSSLAKEVMKREKNAWPLWSGGRLWNLTSKCNNYKTIITLIIYEFILGSWDGNVSVFELETGKNLLEIKPQSWRINGKKTISQLYFSERTENSCWSRNVDYFLRWITKNTCERKDNLLSLQLLTLFFCMSFKVSLVFK